VLLGDFNIFMRQDEIWSRASFDQYGIDEFVDYCNKASSKDAYAMDYYFT